MHKKLMSAMLKLKRRAKRLETKCDTEKFENLKKMSSLREAKFKSRKLKKHEYAFDLASELIRITGVDLTKIPAIGVSTALAIVSEIGSDMSRWRSAKHFASWLGFCPGNKISGGKRLSGKSKPVQKSGGCASSNCC